MSAMSDLTRAVQAVAAAEPGYVEGERMYAGTVDEVHASAVIQRLVGNSSSKFRVNLARRVVDAVLDRLKIASISVPGNDVATARLTELWDANAFGRSAKTINRRALSEGDMYVFVWDDPDDENGVLAHLRPAARCRVFYDAENPRKKTHAAFVWTVKVSEDDTRTRVTLLYPDRLERYITKEGLTGADESDWEHFLDDEETEDDWEIPNPYDEVPVFHFRTGEPYGRPEHFDAYGPQNAINKLVAVHMSSVDYQGLPQRWRLKNTKAITAGPSDGYPDEDGDGDEDDDERLSNTPGGLWDLADTTEVGEFKAADPDVFLKPLNAYARVMGATTGTPLRFMDPSGDVPSGESLRADDAPLTEKIGDRQTWLGDEWSSMLRFMLKVAGVEVDKVKIAWAPVRIASTTEEWETINAKIEAGVPREVALAEAGYRPEEIAVWMQGWSVLDQLRTAIADGKITEEQVAALLNGVPPEPTV